MTALAMGPPSRPPAIDNRLQQRKTGQTESQHATNAA
jgi:hypothetical protein